MKENKDKTEFVEPEEVKERLRREKNRESRLINISGDERNGKYFLVYHIDQGKGKILNLEVELNDKKSSRMVDVFENADLYERESREMYGIDFGEEMKNLFLPEGIQEPSKKELEKGMKKMEEGGDHA